MKIVRNGNVNEHDIEIRSMVGTKDVGPAFIQSRFPADEIKNQSRKKNKMSPNFFKHENLWKPFAARQKNGEQRQKNKKCKRCI
jgi:hypothetical protein